MVYSPEQTPFEEFVSNSNQFTADVYNKIASSHSNLVVCPFFIEVICSVVEYGSKGKTSQEICLALRHPHCRKDHKPNYKEPQSAPKDPKSMFKMLLSSLCSHRCFDLCAINRIYIDKSQAIRKDLRNLAKKYYHTNIENVDFSNVAEAVNTINGSLRSSTKSKISDVVSETSVSVDTKILLVSAVHLQGRWLRPFRAGTPNQDFFIAADEVIKVVMMETVGPFNYHSSDAFKASVVELRFKEEMLSMVVVLPFEREGLSELEDNLGGMLSGHYLTIEYVKVILPKFCILSAIDFNETLKDMGMKVPFTEEADFSDLVTEKNVFISEVVQKTIISVNEAGLDVEISAKEARRSLEVATTKVFNVDHPFFFCIKWKGLIVFAGRVTSPVINL